MPRRKRRPTASADLTARTVDVHVPDPHTPAESLVVAQGLTEDEAAELRDTLLRQTQPFVLNVEGVGRTALLAHEAHEAAHAIQRMLDGIARHHAHPERRAVVSVL